MTGRESSAKYAANTDMPYGEISAVLNDGKYVYCIALCAVPMMTYAAAPSVKASAAASLFENLYMENAVLPGSP